MLSSMSLFYQPWDTIHNTFKIIIDPTLPYLKTQIILNHHIYKIILWMLLYLVESNQVDLRKIRWLVFYSLLDPSGASLLLGSCSSIFVFCVVFCLSFCPCYFGHCTVCPSYFNHCILSIDLQLLITPLCIFVTSI